MSAKTATPEAKSGGKKKLTAADVMAWVSFGFAIVGGAALLGTFIGSLFGWFGSLSISIYDVPVITAALVIGIVVLGLAGLRDIVQDGVPNRTAVWAAILVPCLARGAGGSFATKTATASQQVVTEASVHTAGLFNGPPAYLLAIIGVLGALVLAKRSVKPGTGAI